MSLTSQSPIETLRARYNQAEQTCPQCGQRNIKNSWQVVDVSSKIQFKHVCTNCGAEQRRVVSLSLPDTQ